MSRDELGSAPVPGAVESNFVAISPNDAVPPLYFEPGAFMRKHAVTIWLAIGVAISALTVAVGWRADKRADFLWQTLPLAASLAAIPLAIRYLVDQIAAAYPFWGRFLQPSDDFPNPRQDFKSWFGRELSTLGPSRWMRASGVGLVVLRVAMAPWRHPELSSFRAGYVCALAIVVAYFAGVALCYLVLFSRLVWRFGKFRVRVEAHRFGVRGVGEVMTLAWSLGAVIWCSITSTVVLDDHIEPDTLLFVATPAGCLLVGSFVVCQFPLHHKMQHFKRETLNHLEQGLGALLDKGLSEKETRDFEFLEKRISATLALPEWPFQWRKLAQITSLAFSFLITSSGKLGPLLSDLHTSPRIHTASIRTQVAAAATAALKP